MIDIKQKTLFFKSKNLNNDFIINDLFKFFELIGNNILIVIKEKNLFNSNINCGNTIYFHNTPIEELVSDNLFRVDIIYVICFAHEADDYYYKLRKITNLPIILGIESSLNQETINKMVLNSDASFLFEKENRSVKSLLESNFSNFQDFHFINDLKNNLRWNFSSLKLKWIRNKKLEDLLGEI